MSVRAQYRRHLSGHTCGLLRRILPSVLAVAVVASPACGVSGLSFKTDERVDIVRPGDRDEVELPVTVEWTVEDFDVGEEGSFGVLLDRAPQRPGKSLGWIFRGEDSCDGPAGEELCESQEFLAQRNVFQTTDTEITFELVPKLTGNDRRREFHEVTIVLLDEAGKRIGEGAWSIQFEVKD